MWLCLEEITGPEGPHSLSAILSVVPMSLDWGYLCAHQPLWGQEPWLKFKFKLNTFHLIPFLLAAVHFCADAVSQHVRGKAVCPGKGRGSFLTIVLQLNF